MLGGALGLAIILGPYRRGERWAWTALWIYPAFLVSHVITFGTIVPDAVLAGITAVALLVAMPTSSATD
ncbi:hypothetical protein ACTMS0_18345 [Micromonospora sp. H33]|uniref:hypothetical protein n=1 Tax=Micromonospora sp. H33 TaxID=3452215 RepID=UPI003F8CC49F